MTRYYPLAAALCAVLGVLLIWSTGIQSALFAPPAGDAIGAARLRLDETRCDLGTIAAGKNAQATFHITNDGSRRLVIRKETGHCCGQGGPEEVTIVPPGGSTNLIVDVETTGIHGGLQRDIVYATNDPQKPQLTLTVVGRVAANDQ